MAHNIEDDNETLHFLKRIQPPDGVHQATVIGGRGARNIPCGDQAELADAIIERDRLGQNVYHACATFIDGQSRKANNTRAMQAFWCDVDCGAEKASSGAGYETQEEATLGLKQFCKATGLPRPMIVDSGGGLHIYWPLKEQITPERWKRISSKLKRAAKALGFLVDHSRTTDAASILRPVGTHNRKYDPPRRVALLCDGDVNDPNAFEAALDSYIDKPKRKKQSNQSGLVDDTPRQRARLASMLECISADCDYKTYRDVVWAILSLGWEDAPDLAEAWCLTEPGRFNEENCNAIVNVHDQKRSPSIGTLIHLARQGGWHG